MRNKHLISFILFLPLFLCANAQAPRKQKEIADLYKNLQSQKDTAYINTLIEIGTIYRRRFKMDSAASYFRKTIQLSEPAKYYKGLYESVNGLADINMYRMKHDSAISYYLQALSYSDKIKGRELKYEAESKQGIGEAYLAMNDTTKALPYLVQARNMLVQLKDTLTLIDVERDFAFYHALQPDTAAVVRKYKEALLLCAAYEKSRMGDSMQMVSVDKARLYLIRNVYLFLTTPALRNEAIGYVEAMWKRKDWPEHRFFTAQVALLLASLYERVDNYEKSIEIASIAVQDSTLLPGDMLNLYSTLAMAYYNSDKFKEAADYLIQLHYAYADRFDKEKYEALADLETKYQTEKKVQEIKSLNKQKKSQLIITGISIGAFFIALGLLILLLRANRLQKKLFAKEKELQKKEMEKRMYDLEQTALRAQMNPHFIFNSLNSVQRFVINNDVEGVNQYLSTFANLIRQTLENSGKSLITLKDELKYLETYLRLEQMRGNDKFKYLISVNADIDTEETYIPNMIIQPYVENSIIHGMAGKTANEGIINLTISKNHKLTCIVDDNGAGITASKTYKRTITADHESMGTAITEKRIEMFNTVNQEKIELEVLDKSELSNKESGTRIMIKFPLNPAAN